VEKFELRAFAIFVSKERPLLARPKVVLQMVIAS
jgi:hypothetical protein